MWSVEKYGCLYVSYCLLAKDPDCTLAVAEATPALLFPVSPPPDTYMRIGLEGRGARDNARDGDNAASDFDR
jgi:hypothetical protein